MPFKIERLGNESIIILTISGSFLGGADDLRDYQAAIVRIGQLAAEISGPIYRITDTTFAQLSFGDLVTALGESRTGEKGSVSDPRMKSIFVASHELIQLAGSSLKQDQYGHIEVKVCNSLEDAIAYAREQLAVGK